MFSVVIRPKDVQWPSIHFAHRSLEGCLLEAFSSVMYSTVPLVSPVAS